MTTILFVQIYKSLLSLYPRDYRVSFAAEMVEVFRQSVADAAQQGRSNSWIVFLRELSDLPMATTKEHLSSLANRISTNAAHWKGLENVVTRKELVLTLAAFTIPLVILLLNNSTEYLTQVLPAALIFIGFVIVAGLLRELPRWCLPYLGLALSIITFLVVFNWLSDQILPTIPPWLGPGPREQTTRLLWQGLLTGMMWFSLFIVVLGIWLLHGFVRYLRRLEWPTLQGDWTQVSFVIYGGAMTALVLLFKDFQSKEPFVLTSLLCLATGAWFYLRSSRYWQRLLALLTGITLSFGIAAAGIYLMVPLQPWSWGSLWNTPETERWFEAWRVVLVWVWLTFFLLAPGITKYLRQTNQGFISKGGDEPAYC
jgi:hypothetical protein